MRHYLTRPRAIAIAAGLLLSSCAATESVTPSSQQPSTTAATASAPVATAPIQGQLSQDQAVRLALVNNKSLRALYYRSSLSESAMTDAIASAEGRNTGDPLDQERRFIVAATAPLSQTLASEVDRRKADRTRTEVASEMLQVSNAVRRAWIAAVASAENARYLERALMSAEAGTELARRMVRVGNWPRLNELRERAFQGEVAAQLARARQAGVSEREKLTKLLGLWGNEANYRLPDRLPDLPASPSELPNIEEVALRQRLDLQAARLGIFAEAREFALDGYDRGELFGYHRGEVSMSEEDYFTENGRSRTIRVPVFDRQQARRDLKLLPYIQSVDRYEELAVSARSEAREAYLGYRTAYDVAKHYRDTIIPLRREISEENLLRYNGMLISVFELLTDAREQITSVTSYIEAQREFWTAETDLRLALTVGGAGGGAGRTVRLPGGSAAAGH